MTRRVVVVVVALVMLAAAWPAAAHPRHHAWGGFGPYWDPWLWAWPGGYGAAWYAPTRLAAVTSDLAVVDTDVAPEHARVYLDGRFVGTADDFDGYPDYLYLERGAYQLELRLPGYRTEVRTIEAEEGQYFPIELKLAREPGVKPAPWYDRPQDVVGGRVFGPLRKDEPEAAPGPDPRLRPELQEPVGGPPPSVERGERGALEFRVTPENASVYVDGEFLGTGRELAQMERGFAVGAGEHTVEVLAPRHAPRTLTVSVAAGESRQVVVELEGAQGGQN